MSVYTTNKTRDPYSIIKGRDMLRLLSRGFAVETAKQIFLDEKECEIIQIGNQSISKEKFVKRRQRLIGPNGSTLKALELLSGCSIVIQGKTVTCCGKKIFFFVIIFLLFYFILFFYFYYLFISLIFYLIFFFIFYFIFIFFFILFLYF